MARSTVLVLLTNIILVHANLDYLDPTILQTKTSSSQQQALALSIITQYTDKVNVQVNPLLFIDKKDAFTLKTDKGILHIKASSGVAAVWGFNYYLKKYCKSQIEWQVKRVKIPDPLPKVNEIVVANDRFRYYQNVCTFSYSFVWWDEMQWLKHVEWMALNGINLVLAPSAQESAWLRVYENVGMTTEEIDHHFTGPAFLSWLRMGNVHGWGGPLPKSWHSRQKYISNMVTDYMSQLGMIPILPAFNGHVPGAFARIFPNTTFHTVQTWNKFKGDYCCDLFINPRDPLFATIGKMFNSIIKEDLQVISHIYTSDPFNEVAIEPVVPAEDTAIAIFSAMTELDPKAVWLLQNWMFVHDPVLWPLKKVKSFLTSVPIGRLLILDLQSEQWPQYDLYQMYYGQPFIWCMLHNFGGTLGMFGNTKTISSVVYEVRKRANSTMIGVGLTPEGINQNYVVYDLMLESAWRKKPIENLDKWFEDYAERRYGCNSTGPAWKYLLKSVYSFNGLNRIRGKYVITRRPSFKIKPWAWYKSRDLFEAFKHFVFIGTSNACDSPAFQQDLVDITRQALQYRAEQVYNNFLLDRFTNTFNYNASINVFLDIMEDLKLITSTNEAFTGREWFRSAKQLGNTLEEGFLYELNARNQVTLWGPNGEITDYACKQWSVLFDSYYIPRWRAFLMAALEARTRNEIFDEKGTQNTIRLTVENNFFVTPLEFPPPKHDPASLALSLYVKWANVPGLEDLPLAIITHVKNRKNMGDENSLEDEEISAPTVVTVSTTNIP